MQNICCLVVIRGRYFSHSSVASTSRARGLEHRTRLDLPLEPPPRLAQARPDLAKETSQYSLLFRFLVLPATEKVRKSGLQLQNLRHLDGMYHSLDPLTQNLTLRDRILLQ